MSNITKIEYVYARSATTNPPIYERTEWCLKAGAGGEAEVVRRSCFNGETTEDTAHLSAAQWSQLQALCESERLKEAITASNALEKPPFMPYVGGSTSQQFSLFEGETCFKTEESLPGVNKAVQFVNACFAPKAPPAGGGFAPAPIVQSDVAEWYCPSCGTLNHGNFCTECGTKRE